MPGRVSLLSFSQNGFADYRLNFFFSISIPYEHGALPMLLTRTNGTCIPIGIQTPKPVHISKASTPSFASFHYQTLLLQNPRTFA